MSKARVLIDGRTFSLQQKGGISQLWAYMIGGRLWGESVDTTLLLYPGHEKNLHLQEMSLTAPRRGLRIVHSPIPPSDNTKFDGEVFDATRAQALDAAGVNDIDTVLNTYYGGCVLPGARRYIVTALDFAHEDLPMLAAKPTTPQVLRMKRAAFADATDVSFISNASRQRFFVHYPDFPAAHTHVIHLGHDESQPQVHKVAGLIIHVGSRGAYKNFAGAVEALRRVLAARPATRLLVVGGEALDDDTRRLQAAFAGRVNFVTHLPDAQVDLAVAAAHVYLSPSQYEGFGIPLLNALRLGTVPCVSNIPVYRELAHDRAEYFDPQSPDSIEAALQRALDRSVPAPTGYVRTWNDVARDYVRLIG